VSEGDTLLSPVLLPAPFLPFTFRCLGRITCVKVNAEIAQERERNRPSERSETNTFGSIKESRSFDELLCNVHELGLSSASEQEPFQNKTRNTLSYDRDLCVSKFVRGTTATI
jgi:hypothetical protein